MAVHGVLRALSPSGLSNASLSVSSYAVRYFGLPATAAYRRARITPGTVTAALSDDRRYLLVHVLDLADEAALVADIKRRYECPLMEIFP